MPVAPSFEDYKRISVEPFTKNGKYYVTVEHSKTGNRRDVRWYSESEFAKAYGKKILDTDRGYDNLKHMRGFDNGPILVIRGNKAVDEEWLRASAAQYIVGVGWYFASTEVLPTDAPANFKYLLLGWKEFINGDERHQKSPAELSTLLDVKARKKEWVKF